MALTHKRQPGSTTNNAYERGRAAGAEWACRNILPDPESAPFIPGIENSQYNLGVLNAIVSELERLAAELRLPPKAPLDSE